MKELFKVIFSNGSSANAVRVHLTAELPSALHELGLQGPRPTLVLVGGAGGMDEADLARLRPLFVQGLAPLAQEHGACVVDGGTDVGVMRLMGMARAEIGATYPLVGVAVEKKVVLPSDAASPSEGSPLEPHHTHFVLVPGSNWGDESSCLANVAQILSAGTSSVTVLVNGGETARKDVSQSKKAGRPVVVVTGTGRLADELGDGPSQPPIVHVVHLDQGLKKVASMVTALLGGGQDGQV